MRRIDNIQFTLIASQLETMREYLSILNKRIKYDREKKEK
ncbi:crAss001_48 related protein [Fusobacterium perfoetens]